MGITQYFRNYYVGLTDPQRRAFELGREIDDAQRLGRLELRVAALEEPVKHEANTMKGDDYERLVQNYEASASFAERQPELAKEYGINARIHAHNRRVDEAMFRPVGDKNPLLGVYDGMRREHAFLALLDLLENREVMLVGVRLTRKNLRHMRQELQKRGIDVQQFAQDPS